MATHDYVIANGTGAAVRSDLNDALAAIVSNNSGSSEPGTTYAYQWWADTTANVLKIRNSANNAWITLRELDGTMLMEDGSNSAPGLSFASDTNTGFFSGGADKIGFATGGVERLEIGSSEVVFNDPSNDVDFRVESNGQTHMLFVDAGNDRVGIGQSSPGYRLDVDAGSTTSGGLRVSGSSSPQIRLEEGSGVTASLQLDGATGYVGTISNHPFVIRQNTSERARIDTSGRLLVGTSSSVPKGTEPAVQIFRSDLSELLNLHLGFDGDGSTAGARLVLSRSTSTTHGGNDIVQNGHEIGGILFKGDDGVDYASQAASIKCFVDGTPGSNDMPGRLVLATTADGAASPTERVRINSSGDVGIGESAPLGRLHLKTGDSGASSVGASADELVIEGSANSGITILSGTTGQGLINFGDSGDVNIGNITYDHDSNFMSFKTNDTERMRITSLGYLKASENGTYNDVNSGAYHEFVQPGTSVNMLFRTTRSNTAATQVQFGVDRAATSAYWFVQGVSSWTGTADTEFYIRGDGNAFADGSWSGGGADYAEYFEWSDGNTEAEDRRGISVVLDGDKIREAVAGEEPIGVVSGNPSVVGDADVDRWKGKYLRDDYGSYVLDEDGYRQLNPDYDSDVEYVQREDRAEWDTVGLMGKLRIRKGQVTGTRWIKMRDVSDTVEEWLVR